MSIYLKQQFINTIRDKIKYCIIAFRKNWKNRVWWKYLFVSQMLSSIIFRNKRNSGHYILKENWDNLIILDACRFDVFKEEIKKWNIKGELEYRISRGSWTVPFLLENFKNIKDKNLELNDIVYITANPYVSALFRDMFYKIIPVWDFGWDESLKTVPPKRVYEAALKAKLRYPRKKLIIHFIQPHEPFVNLRENTATGFSRLRHAVLSENSENTIKHDVSIWDLVEKGVIDRDDAIKGYIENLRWVMPYVIRLCKVLPGKTVITSDHGEAFGEKIHPLIPIRVYGHPDKVRIRPLIIVPWFICEESGSLNRVEKVLIRLKAKDIRLF